MGDRHEEQRKRMVAAMGAIADAMLGELRAAEVYGYRTGLVQARHILSQGKGALSRIDKAIKEAEKP